MSDQRNYCSDRCHKAAARGSRPYAPCPLIHPWSGDKFCAMCGWYVPTAPPSTELS